MHPASPVVANFRVAVVAAALGSSATSLVQNLFEALWLFATNLGNQLSTILFRHFNIARQSLDNVSRVEALPRHLEQVTTGMEHPQLRVAP